MKIELSKQTDFFENTLPALMIVITPLLASFAPAAFLFKNLTTVLSLHPAVALLIALAAECVGITSITIYLKIKRFNQKHIARKHQISTLPAILAYTIYITSIIITNALLDFKHQPIEISAARIFLSLLSFSGALLFAVNFAMSTTEADIATAKAKRKRNPAKRSETQRSAAKPDPLTFACSAPGCGFLAKSQNALNAHSRKHVTNKNGNKPKSKDRKQIIQG